MSYHQFKSEDGEYGSFEVFYYDGNPPPLDEQDEESIIHEAGYYWWACFPGCMPDGEPMGPYATEKEAIEDAQSF